MTVPSNKWQEIWEKREEQSTDTVLQKLIYLNGFDSGAGKISDENWQQYTCDIKSKLDINPADSLFEIGCGSGAFLYPFYEAGHRVGGSDYSAAQIGFAKEYMSDVDDLDQYEANKTPPVPRYDFVLSNGVFHYFPDLHYAKTVLEVMWTKARKAIFISEIPDAELKSVSEDIRRGSLSEEEYDEKYKGLEHLYYTHKFFEDFAKEVGGRIHLESQSIRDYKQNSYRFNCIIRK